MKWNTEYFGFRLLVFVGFCGEVPVALLRKTGGCYDYRRRVVTELVRTGYLKERKFRGERRRVVRSLSLTSRGLNQIQHLSPGRAEQIRARLLAPADGQGDWRRTQRLHRNAACLLLAGLPLSAGAAGSPSVSGSNPFRDVASGDYFYRPVLWAVRNNITAGTSATTFSPNDGCTRGQIVTFLYKHYAS